MFAAAKSCDWSALRILVAEPFISNSLDDVSPIVDWQRREEEGERVLSYLVELLNQPYLQIIERDVTYYYWPSAFAEEGWYLVSLDERLALERLYEETDFRMFEDAGAYNGYRVGITSDGDWFAFLTDQ